MSDFQRLKTGIKKGAQCAPFFLKQTSNQDTKLNITDIRTSFQFPTTMKTGKKFQQI